MSTCHIEVKKGGNRWDYYRVVNGDETRGGGYKERTELLEIDGNCGTTKLGAVKMKKRDVEEI